MKLLLLYPEDSPFQGPWSKLHWDYIIDLGWAGTHAYTEWEKKLDCPVRGLYGFATGPEDIRATADILQPGMGRLVDEQGLDWWEILAPVRFQRIFELVMVQRTLREVNPTELASTRSHPMAELFASVAGIQVSVFHENIESPLRRQLRKIKTATSLLSVPQLLQAALDKWDPDYRFRVHVSARGSRSTQAILMPSGYANVTRVLTEYAALLPQRNFFLVTTRRGGTMRGLGANVRSAALAGYAPVGLSDSTRREVRALKHSWSSLQRSVLSATEDLSLATQNGWFQDIGQSFESWLRVRDAWRTVLEEHRISAVLCGDENNPTNRIPVLLAKKLHLPTIHCDHGALNVLLPLRAPACDTYLVKGAMELDFMERTFPINRSRIFMGAPSTLSFGVTERAAGQGVATGSIVFFSEQYELTYGRTSELYQEILPPLCAIARAHGARVIVKLHPFESPTSRLQLIAAVLSPADRDLVDLVYGPLSQELLRKTWFAVTVESSVSVDCAVRGIPCFLCGWFVTPFAGYAEQFARYGAARLLASPGEISRIPEMLLGFRITPEVQRGLWNSILPATLEALLQKS